jgi:hypothetical protein
VTESEWLACADPGAMLRRLNGDRDYAAGLPAAPPSDRKLRLYACACARQAWHLLSDPRGRNAVEVAERYADGEGDLTDRLRRCDSYLDLEAPHGPAWVLAFNACRPNPDRLREAIMFPSSAVNAVVTPALQAALLRDVVGNPWRPATLCGLSRRPFHNQWAHVDVNGSFWLEDECPVCRPLRTPAVLGIARRAYDLRDWDALPVLADALEEAGCEDTEVLGHLRGWGRCGTCLGRGASADGFWDCVRCGGSGRITVGPHVRGCWSLDVILGKG